MKRSRIYMGLILLALIAVIFFASYSLINMNRKEGKSQVSVIVDNSNEDRWIAMREGLEQAANDFDIELNYVSTGKMTSVTEEQDLINREVENGVDGLIIQLISSYGNTEYLDGITGSCKLVLMENDSSPEGTYPTVQADNWQIGVNLLQEMEKQEDRNLDELKIGILSGNQNQTAMTERLNGLKEALGKRKTYISWTINTTTDDLAKKLNKTLDKHPVDIIFSLGNDETETAVDVLATKPDRVNYDLYGVGCSDKNVYYLDKGNIKALIVPNEFNMGYQSVEKVAEQITNKLDVVEGITVEDLIVTKDNLYDEDTEKTLFPIVQ